MELVRGFQELNHGETALSSFYSQIDTRWNSFVERCRQEWLGIHAFSTLIAR